MTIKNFWSKCMAVAVDNTEHEEKFLRFTKNVREASSTIRARLQVNDRRARVREDDETPVAVNEDDEIVGEALKPGRRRAFIGR
jgi:hypothetical protein